MTSPNVLDVYETNFTITFQLVVTGDNFGAVPIFVVPLSYGEFDARNISSRTDVGGSQSLPTASALPCN